MRHLIQMGLSMVGRALQPVQSSLVHKLDSVLYGVDRSQGRSSATKREKPHLRLTRIPSFYRQYWICLDTPDNWYRGGVGLTPQEAYADWERQRG